MDTHMVNVHHSNNLTTATSLSDKLIQNEIKMRIHHFHFKEFPVEWEINILNLLSWEYRKKYRSSTKLLLREIKDMYNKDMQDFMEKIVLANPSTRENDFSHKSCLKYSYINQGVCNHNTYLKNRKLLLKKYFLSLEPIRLIINEAQLKFTIIICNFEQYHCFGLMSLADFQNIIVNDIKNASAVITNQFYTGIAKTISVSKVLKNNIPNKLTSIMRCITHVFVQQIINVMIKSIDHMLKFLSDGYHCPQIKFKLILQNGCLLLSPSIEETYSVYYNIIERISVIAQDLIPLEEWFNIKTHVKYINIKLPDWYIKESNSKLQNILDNLFNSLNKHVANINEEFYPVCSLCLREEILSLTTGQIDFDLYLKNIKHYNTYLVKANVMVLNTYHIVGKLEQCEAIKALKKESCNIINAFLNKLIKYHQELNLSICSEFEDLKTKALNIPRDSTSLIELCDYISHIGQELTKELEKKIQKSINMIMILSEMTVLTKDHIQLNVKTINWLHEIEPIFKQSNVLSEAMKTELEDDMQKRISNLNAEVDSIVPQLSVLNNMDDINNIEEYVEYYKSLLKQATQINYEMQTINEEENLFKFPETEFPNVIDLYEIITSFYDLIYIIYQWKKDNSVWLDGPFEWLDTPVIETKTLDYFERITDMSKMFKTKIKMDVSANKCFKFTGIADDPDPLQQPAPLKLCWQALNDINAFKKYLPLVKCMCNSALQKRHWKEMSAIYNFDLTPNAGTSLRKLIAFNLMDDIEKYDAISIGANRELELEQKLLNMIKEWNNISFKISFDKNLGQNVFSNLNDIELLINDHLIKIEEMKTSNFVKEIVSTITHFFINLTRLQEIIDQWYYIQMLLCSLNATFCYPSMGVHLSEESTSYDEIKIVLQNIEIRLSQSFSLIEISDIENLKSLNNTMTKLEHINQKVTNYIETKKLSFPRFCFLSDKEIQEILFEAYKLNKLHFLIQKCFQGIEKVKINKEKCICSIFGDCGEEVSLEKFIPFSRPYDHEEKWLMHFADEIKSEIKKKILLCNETFSDIFIGNNIQNFPSMIIVCAFQLYWTSEVHNCFTLVNSQILNTLYCKYIHHLHNLSNQLKNYSTKRHRDLLMTLIIIVIHQKDIIRLLLDRNVTMSTDFEWLAQLRYYREDNDIKISVFQATVKYGYEYSYYRQGIINTPLTNRCYHTLMQAYTYHYYGNVSGPPATGKSETVKSLTKAIAIQFRVFNCAAISSYNVLSQILKGFLSCETWLCFENFDKLKTDLIARITQALISIFQSIVTNSKIIMFDGSSLKVCLVGHICVITELGLHTYSALPDNLRGLFRSVSMLVPDMTKIVEVELFAAGISDSQLLATKLITFYKMLSQQLCCDPCKSFNLCSVKAMIKTIGYLKRSFPEENETAILLRSLIDINISKFCDVDVHIFKIMVQDMFPGVSLPPPNYATFLETFETVCNYRSIHIHDVLKLKIIQLFELMHIYQSLIIIGEPFVGKTEILNVLQAILLSLYEQGVEFGANVDFETVVPGVIDPGHLFGHFDERCKIWKDGICSKILHSFSKNDSFAKRWIVFDGPLNNVWIEHLYTVLGTNNILQLTSAEKIRIANSVSIIFETMNLTNVSPAIVSNCGIIYIESNSIDWRSYMKTYFSKHNIYNEHKKTLYILFDWAIDPCLQFVQKYCSVTSDVGQLHYVMSTLNLFHMYLGDILAENTEEKGKMNHLLIWIQIILILAIIWGIGGNLDSSSHNKFNAFCISLWNGTNKEYPKPEIIKSIDITLPHEGLIQDNFYIFKGVGSWKYWGSTDVLKNEQILEIPDCNEVFVPTIDTMKYNYLLLKHVKYKKPLILCGGVSTGKTFLLRNFLKNKLSREMCFNWFSFLFLSTVPKTQQMLMSKSNKITKIDYGSPNGQLCIHFIDDLNISSYEYTEVNSVLELFRQYHSYGYLYDTNEPEKVFIHNIMFLFSITETTITDICPRFLRHFQLYTMYAPATETIYRIFSNILFSNLRKNFFTADVLNSVSNISRATVEIYNCILKTLRPVPTKFQYKFNMRDITKVINGCSLLQKESVEAKVTFHRLWAHEIWRVFGDRILDNNDKEWLFQKVREIGGCHFKDSFETAFDYLPKSDNNEITKDSFNNLLFCNFMDSQNDNSKKYEEVHSIKKLQNKIYFYLNECNNSNFRKRIDLVVTEYVLECLIKISRILAIPGGHLLVISSIGSGRKSLASLAAHMQQQELFEPLIYSNYDFKMWRTDLKTVLQKCGSQRQNLTLLIKHKPGKDDFLYDIICFLACNEIPDLFTTEERCTIIQTVRLLAQGGDKNAEINNHAVMSYFLEQCKNRLHIILCFNTTNEAVRLYLNKYPELVKYCTINWYEMWSTNTLMQIATKYTQDINIEEDMKMNVIKGCLMLHNNIQEQSFQYYKDTNYKVHVTLSAFLHMMKLYSHLMLQGQKDILIKTDKYLVGLQKLELAAAQVEQMRGTLTILKPQLESSAQKTVTTMQEVEKENITIKKATVLIQQEEEIANKKAEVAGRLKLECETDLAVAIPILEDAIAALNTLKPTDITLVKAMKNPPDTVKLVMAAICVMLDVAPDKAIDSVTGNKYIDYWSPSKRILGDLNFLQILKDYDKDNIAPTIIEVIKETFMTDNNFKPHIVAKASSAAEGLCKWVHAMVSYNEIANAVAPKKEKLIIAQKECNEVEAFLNKKRKTLSILNAKLVGLKSNLQEILQQKLKLEEEVRNCTNKLHKAENLMASLGGEKDRWIQFAEGLNKNYDNLAGDMILTCGIISYLGSYNATFRNQIIDYWKQCIQDLKIPFSRDYELVNVLGEESDINYWLFSGLPKNEFLIDNVLIMKNSKLWSLFIDSQNQANEWIKIVEEKNNLKVIKLTDLDHIVTIRYNVEKGIPTLIENVNEDLELLLNPFLLKNIYSDDEYSYLDTGSEIIKYSFDFRLYMTTRLNNPQFSCEIFSKLTIIDFSIPNEAIQDRLLDFIISKEKPELQHKLEALLMEDANNKNILKKQESIILNILSSSTINILEDECALKSLDSSKSLSLGIIRKQELVKIMLLEMKEFRSIYIHFVQYCVELFNTSTALSHLNHMYCFSFAWLMQLYRRSIETSNRSIILERQLKYLKSSFTKNLHASICRSLSEKHKILYSFLLCCKILLNDQQTTEEEIKYFMITNLNHFSETKNYMFNWLPNCIWNNICNLSRTFPIFSELVDHFCSNEKAWEQYYNSESFQDHLMPDPWSNKLSLFQKLILVRILRLDRTILQITQMIEKILGNTQTYSPQLKISESYVESNCLTPLLFILPSSLEPLSLISAYAKIKGCLLKFISLSMSKGQEEMAELLIQKAQEEGSWVFIQNCHLVPHWMIQLEKICENSSTSNVSLNFRLWLSSYSMKEFPISILQNSIKIIHNYPLSVKDALLNIYESTPITNKDLFEDYVGGNKTLLTLVFGICLFHTVIQERMNFGVQGWHIPYKFDHNDLQISIMQLQYFINNTNHVPFNTVLYLIGECNYGGKVEDEFDSRCLKYLLNDYCNPNIIACPEGTCLNHIEELIPQTHEYYHVIEYIREMGSDLSPEVFGSDRNAINIRNIVTAEEFLSSLLCIYFPTSVIDKQLCQDKLLCLIHDINNKLCNSIQINEIQKECTSMLGEPLQRVLFCEIKSLRQVLETICKTLNTLKLALNGNLPYTDSLKEFAEDIYKHRIPHVWRKAQGYIVTADLSSNINNLLKRAAFINNWFNEGNPKIIWLDTLFHCKMFFTTISLIFSKKYNIPVEKINLDFEITTNKTIDINDADTYLICGLHLCGARWDLEKNMLIQNLTNETWQQIPPVCVKYSQNKGNTDEVYECPIYVTPANRDTKFSTDNYIFSIPLKSNIPQAYWIKCGVALFCHILQ